MENLDKIRIKPIKTQTDYFEAINSLEKLISDNPKRNTDKYEKINILSKLLHDYEKQSVPQIDYDAIDAIEFRMDQLNLKAKDLIPYIGSASRVSEIMSRKRPLTTEMIRDLSNNLGIPEKMLLRREKTYFNIPTPVFKQMLSRGYFGTASGDQSTLLKIFFNNAGVKPTILYRKSKFRTRANDDHYIAIAWATRVKERANKIKIGQQYTKVIDLKYMRELAHYSIDEKNGAILAINALRKRGIRVIVEPALNGAKIDGVCILDDPKEPIIGLSLRYDRLDNFWFTLMHELAHVSLHANHGITHIYDDMQQSSDLSNLEKEADTLASEALIDSSLWSSSPARIIPSPLAATALANKIGVHVAIVAGKARYESGDWKYLANFVKSFTIRDKFKELKW